MFNESSTDLDVSNSDLVLAKSLSSVGSGIDLPWYAVQCTEDITMT